VFAARSTLNNGLAEVAEGSANVATVKLAIAGETIKNATNATTPIFFIIFVLLI